MATQKNIVQFAQRKDEAARAAERMSRAVSDATYERARRAFAKARPTTAAGVLAKANALRAVLESLRAGDSLTNAGWVEAFALYDDVATPLQDLNAVA